MVRPVSRFRSNAVALKSRPRTGGFLVGALLALLLTQWVWPLAAWADSPGEDCINTRFNEEGTDTGQFNNQDGIRADLYGGSWNSLGNGGDCDRVTSIAVNSVGGTGAVEFGWVLGWLPRAGVDIGADKCNDDYYKLPHLFMTWTPIGGVYHCRDLANHALEGDFTTFSVTDNDLDTVWKAYFQGNFQGNANVNFTHGHVITNGERHNQAIDTAYAHFQALKKQVVGDGNTWFAFCCSSGDGDINNDPGFHWHLNSNTDTEVLRNT
jgi:hypothetical protein